MAERKPHVLVFFRFSVMVVVMTAVMSNHFVCNFIAVKSFRIIRRPMFHFFGKGGKTFVSEIQVEMLRMNGRNFMVAELNVFRRAGACVRRFKEVANALVAGLVDVNPVALVIVL